eukprot:COSAG01_NODE_5945_length_3940_cov_3.383494_5_plen_99_part_00
MRRLFLSRTVEGAPASNRWEAGQPGPTLVAARTATAGEAGPYLMQEGDAQAGSILTAARQAGVGPGMWAGAMPAQVVAAPLLSMVEVKQARAVRRNWR